MKKFKQVILLVVALLLAAVVILFILENRAPVSVLLFKYSTPELPVALYITFSLILGLILSPIFTWLPLSRLRLSNRKLRNEVKTLTEQNHALTKQLVQPTTAELIVVEKP